MKKIEENKNRVKHDTSTIFIFILTVTSQIRGSVDNPSTRGIFVDVG